MAMTDLLPIVDARELPHDLRELLAPGEEVEDGDGAVRIRPIYYYRVDSWEIARNTTLAPNMSLYEFLYVDLHEHPLARSHPRYVPCAVTVLAAHLSALRQHFGTYLHISANGGFRTKAHAHSDPLSCHTWGTAADVYRVGDDFLEDEETINRYAERIRQVMPGIRIKPFGSGAGETDDHLHLDVGYLVVAP